MRRRYLALDAHSRVRDLFEQSYSSIHGSRSTIGLSRISSIINRSYRFQRVTPRPQHYDASVQDASRPISASHTRAFHHTDALIASTRVQAFADMRQLDINGPAGLAQGERLQRQNKRW